MADAKSDSSNGPSFLGGQQDGSLTNNNPFAKSKFGSSLLRPPQLKPVLGSIASGTNSSTNAKDDSETKVEAEAPKFVPLGAPGPPATSVTATAPSAPAPTTTAAPSFVFGQNLSERVLSTASDRPSLFSSATTSASIDHANTNGNSEMLFSTAIHEPKESLQGRDEGLFAAAAEYEARHARAAPLPAEALPPPLTGEEGERNVLQLSCRLFAFEAGAWRERGRGTLRLNDNAAGGSRLVLRTAGSLRVLINTKVWPEMVVERAGAKSLRLTATDAQARVNVFLIMAGPDDIGHLYRVLSQRVALLKKASPSASPSPSAPSLLMTASYRLPQEEDLESDPDDRSDKCEERVENSANSTRESEEYHNRSDAAVAEESGDVPSESAEDKSSKDHSSPDSARSLKRKEESEDNEDGSPKRLKNAE